jgi:hypothetical protein
MRVAKGDDKYNKLKGSGRGERGLREHADVTTRREW